MTHTHTHESLELPPGQEAQAALSTSESHRRSGAGLLVLLVVLAGLAAFLISRRGSGDTYDPEDEHGV